jgi:hypothetical protein
MTTHPTDLDTLLKEERAKNERLERHRDMLKQLLDDANAHHFDATMRAEAAEASSLTARRDALEEAAKVADREQDECAEHEDNAFTDSVAARWSAAADAAHRIAAGIRALASTVPGGEETRRTLTRAPERPELERLLREAAKRPMTPAEMREQRKSWVRGQLGLAHPEWDADDLRRRVDAADEAVYGPHEMKEEDLG